MELKTFKKLDTDTEDPSRYFTPQGYPQPQLPPPEYISPAPDTGAPSGYLTTQGYSQQPPQHISPAPDTGAPSGDLTTQGYPQQPPQHISPAPDTGAPSGDLTPQGYPQLQLQPPQHISPAPDTGAPSGYLTPQGYPQLQLPPPQYIPPVQQPVINVVVVKKQPATITTNRVQAPIGDYYLTLSIVMSIVCGMCCGLISLCCTVPAIIISRSAKQLAASGNLAEARNRGNMSLALNIAAIVALPVMYVSILGVVGLSVSAGGSSGSSDYVGIPYYDNYNYYYGTGYYSSYYDYYYYYYYG